jgi:hypothetical protein
MSAHPKIVYVDSPDQLGGKLGTYWGEPYDTIYIVKGLDQEMEAEVLAHEMAHAMGDALGEKPCR